ncbi:MAG TPA: amidase [Opitutaceae bacterium]|nr:amidase [Opitutaceae bacterium]
MAEPPNTFSFWQDLARDPVAAARELRRRVTTQLAPAQQRAAVAWLPAEEKLAAAFAAAPAGAPLRGVPYFLKDLFDLAGVPTFAGSTFLPEVRPVRGDAMIVQALRRAGAVAAGKTQLHEFAYGITGENPNYGDCDHPRFPGRTTGGSSSGAVAAVAAGIVPLSIGSDTGGSVRVPAAFCGLFGFRMTPHHPWIDDAFPLAPSFDTAGWFTGNAGDLLAANAALLGLGTSRRELRGCYVELGRLDPDVAAACREAAGRLCAPADTATREGLTQAFAGATDSYTVQTGIEASQAHAAWLDSHRGRYSPTVWERLDRGRQWSEADRGRAAVVRQRVRATWSSYFLTFDYLVLPAVPCPALTKAECNQANRVRLLELTTPASLGGLPVLTVPVALPSGLSAGLQVVVNHLQSPVIPWALDRYQQE